MAAFNIETQTINKIRVRILPLLALALFFSWLDKANISFAALQINSDLGFSNTVFGLGAGFFGLGYALFAIPGTLLMKRFGARKWIGLVLIACGGCSAAMALVTEAYQLYFIRTLLGMAEASISPGIIIFLGYWLPLEYRGRAWSLLLLISPFGLALGGPISGLLLNLDGLAGVAGWRWLFLMEAIPTFLIALAIFILLRNKPDEANWLALSERSWLVEKLARERREVESTRSNGDSANKAFMSGRLWTLTLINFGMGAFLAGPIFFLPLIIQSMGFSATETGWLVMLPAIAGGLTLPAWGYWTDHAHKREVVLVAAWCMIVAGLFIAAALMPSPWALGGFTIAMMGMYGTAPVSAMLPFTFLSGAAIAVAMGMVSMAVNLGSFAGSYMVGSLVDLTGSYTIPLVSLGLIAMLCLILSIALFVRNIPSPQEPVLAH